MLPHWDERLPGGLERRASTAASEDLIHYVEDRTQKDGAKLGTVAYELQTLRRGYRWKATTHALPVPTFPSLDPQNARQGFLEEYEMRTILDRLPGPTRLIVRFLSITGWRSSEAKTLTRDRVDWRNGQITLAGTNIKTKEPRTLPFSDMPELSRC
jgi:integrase